MSRHQSLRCGWAPALIAAVGLAAGGCDQAQPPSSGGASPTGAQSADDGPPWFTEITESAGIDFVHATGASGEYFMEEIMGSGAALLDIDGDRRLDIYLINGARSAAAGDKLYRQRADGTFEDISATCGIRPASYGMGCATGDYDDDGDVDLYLTNLGADELWRNNGDGTFTNATADAGIDNASWSVSAAFVDYDHDGHLDLYVANYLNAPHHHQCSGPHGGAEYCAPTNFQSVPDKLFHNEGGGRFRDASSESGVGTIDGPGLGVLCADFNRDGRVDIYVANDGAGNFLWTNQGDGTFLEQATLLGCAYNRYGRAEAGMGVTIGDGNHDGHMDLFMTHVRGETNTLYTGTEAGSFDDATDLAGLGLSSMPLTGFGTAFLDADHDGDLDLVVANGAIRRRDIVYDEALVSDYWKPYAEPNLFYEGVGGWRFIERSDKAGSLSAHMEVSRGLALGDIDADGDLDVLITNADGAARLLRNDSPKAGRWLHVRTVRDDAQRDDLGAWVSVRAGGRRFQRQVLSAYSYACSNQPTAHFGLGPAAGVDEVIVTWSDGLTERFTDVPIDAFVELRRGDGAPVDREGAP